MKNKNDNSNIELATLLIFYFIFSVFNVILLINCTSYNLLTELKWINIQNLNKLCYFL